MHFTAIDPACIAQDWPVIAAILAPAVQQDPRQTLEGLRKRLEAGADRLLHIGGDADGLMVIEVTPDPFCWVKYAGGMVQGGPKRRIAAIRQALELLETLARQAGCTEMRLCGRDWSRICVGYEAFDGARNGLRKAL